MPKHICSSCGYDGTGKKTPRGSKGIEIALWTTLLLPGPIYSLWRRVNLPVQCPNCGKYSMVKYHSDAGWVIRKRIEVELNAPSPAKAREPQAETAGVETQVSLSPPAEVVRVPKAPIDPEAW